MNTPTVYTKAEENLVRSTHKFKDCVFGPLMKILSWLGVSPNFIAFLSAFTLVSTLIVAVQMLNPLIFIYGLWLHFILDSLDGPLARFQNRASSSGAITDTIVDFLGVLAATIFTLQFLNMNSIIALCFAVLYLLEIYNSFLATLTQKQLEFGLRPRLLFYIVLTLDVMIGSAYTNPTLLILCIIMLPMVIWSFRHIYKQVNAKQT